MGKYSKEQAIEIVTLCAKQYKENLSDKTLLLVCVDKHNKISTTTLEFSASNFLHLTGLKTLLSANDFFERCLNHKISKNDFDFSEDGTTPLKLDVLPLVINKNLSAKMVGDWNTLTPKLYTEKLVGGISACVGFVSTGKGYHPNTVLKADIRNHTINTIRIIAIFRKKRSENTYEEITYKAKKVDWSKIQLPLQFQYLETILT